MSHARFSNPLCLVRHLAFGAICVVVLLSSRASAIQQWNNPGTGAAAGNWFVATNWTPTGVPDNTLAASINNGGESSATTGVVPLTALQIDVGKNNGTGALTTHSVEVLAQGSIDIGVIDSLFANGPMTTTAMGQASFSNAASLIVGVGGIGDINAGQTSAANAATASGTGSVSIQQIADVTVSGDVDLGQASGTGTATAIGTAAVQGISGQFSIGGDLDVGQTSGSFGGLNSGTGQLTASQINLLQIANDFDIGQSSGNGQSSGQGTVQVSNVTSLTIGDSLDIAKIRALSTAINNGIGSAIISNSTLSIGFGVANPGSIEIARVLVSETARGRATGTLVLDNVHAQIANDVIIGELALGGTNATSSANGTMLLIDSLIDTRDLTVASRFDGTQGTVLGRLELTRSLALVGSMLGLAAGSTLAIDIDGTTRATGNGAADEYGAIDTEQAALAGALEIHDNPSYTGPAVRGATDQFQLITSLLGITGGFSTISYEGTMIGSNATYVGETSNGTDGLFATVSQTVTEVILQTYLALPGDANGDGAVDGSDFGIWNANKFTTGNNWIRGDFNGDGAVDGSDFGIWNSNKFTSVDSGTLLPEPSSLVLSFLCVPLFARRRHSATR